MPQVAYAEAPIDLIGGVQAVHRLASVFYDLIEEDPAYAELRAMHAADLDPLRESLAGFLAAWLGGPRDWFATHPGICMMSLHRSMPITALSAGQWVSAMERAMAAVDLRRDIGEAMLSRFRAMADAMAR